MVIYTVQSYTVFRRGSALAKRYVFLRQNVSMFFMHFICFLVLFLNQPNSRILVFYGAQVVYLLATLVLFSNLYPRASRLLINNMCMLITIGFIMITRLSFDQAVKQFKIIAAGTLISLLIPVIVRKMMLLTKMAWAYTFVGIGLLGMVLVAARVTNGAKLSLNVGGYTFQPSEFVKIIFVFAIAGLLSEAKDMRRIIIATGLAAVHVLILVVSRDLGSALIFFITYLVVLFAATRDPFLTLLGLVGGAIAAVIAYFLFAHIRVRVQIWLDPFADYSGTGYQICQSLFSIAAGGWLGTGLTRGTPGMIPYVQEDFMFSAIAEEMGTIFGVCLILVCMSCFIMFINIAMKLTNRFYRLVALGLGTTYAVQVFLTIGGGTKLIPMTGVTLPLVSYGGSSALSTIVIFAIVQGLYMLRVDEERKDEQINTAPGPGGWA
ncbi:MAG: FtsW/RodA/SpoVE family cell cycle protein, partial [Lachnospiraceae bacterium]|nr:FtsW/RodA/SpoVE family cell cycle protein [Lachnospiraceae bacterium]